MLASVIIGTILFIVALVIYLEYRNEKKYRQERLKRESTKRKPKKPEAKVSKRPAAVKPPREEPKKTKEVPESDVVKREKPVKTVSPKKTETALKAEAHPQVPAEKTNVVPETPPAAEKDQAEEKQLATQLPEGNYPDFNYSRLIEMGLSEEEAMEFIQELIPQIGNQIPLIDEAMKIPDFHKMERLTHSIKGSSTTIGTGGVSDLLVDYNTYLKTGEELPVAEAYQEHLKRYFEKLKKQFPPKE